MAITSVKNQEKNNETAMLADSRRIEGQEDRLDRSCQSDHLGVDEVAPGRQQDDEGIRG
jgi:hypothetical protein